MIAKYYPVRRRANQPYGNVIFRIGVITDTHFRAGVDENPSAPGSGNGGPRIYYASNSKMRDFVDKVGARSDLDFIVHLGDACDSPSDWPFFNTEWDKVTLPKAFVIGNHDMDDLDYEELLEEVGYDGNVEYGGSKFNQHFDFDDVRIICLDSQYDENGDHTADSRSRISPAGIAWLGSMLLAADGHVLVFSHNIPHYRSYPSAMNPYFPDGIAADIQDIITSSLSSNVALRSVNWFGGHAHTAAPIAYANLGQCMGYRLPDSIEHWNDNESSVNGMSVLNLHSNGVITIDSHTLDYPYPS